MGINLRKAGSTKKLETRFVEAEHVKLVCSHTATKLTD